MGDLRDWSPEINGVVPEERLPSSSSSSSPSPPLYSNDSELWRRAEEATQEIIAQVQPTVLSEERRKAVIDYVQRLLRNNLGCEVFPFGSVPLKTYLPDGDIDLTIFGGMKNEEAMATDLYSVLESEEHNSAAEFVVKELQLIPAEVKIVKCLVQNIVVDISFNRLGGLCTQCFLEQVDRLIGKDHLFKRSIILIKAWCYYESRILGAHYGLFSTYALETLILYIFNLFHSSLSGPLEVLYKFLDYFGKFDWDNLCISLNGLISLSTWPEVVVETPGNCGADLLFSKDFLKDCLEKFSDPSRGIENNLRSFSPKHINIVDPLNENNNLGRSISQGNFYRIRIAFNYGAQKLHRILSQTEENVRNELRNFFPNTLDRHGSGQRPDVQGFIPMSRYCGLAATSSISGIQSSQEDQMAYKTDSANLRSMPVNCWLDHDDPLHKITVIDHLGRQTSERNTSFEPQNSGDESAVSENHLSGVAEDIATSRIQGLAISSNSLKSSLPTNAKGSNSLSVKVTYASKPYYSSSSPSNVEMRSGQVRWKLAENSSFSEKKEFSGVLPSPGQEKYFSGQGDQTGNKSIVNQEAFIRGSRHHPPPAKSNGASEDQHPGSSVYPSSTSLSENHEASNSLADLCGDYDSHLNSLLYGRWRCDAFLNRPVSPMHFQRKNSWDAVRPFRQNSIPPINANGVVPRPGYPQVKPPFSSGAGLRIDEMQKQRGTGTYLPNVNHYRDKFFPARGRNQAPGSSPRSNGHHIMPFRETNSPERSSHELSQPFSNGRQGGGRFEPLDLRHSASAENIHHPYANGSMQYLDRVEESGSSAHVPSNSKPPTPESSQQSNPASPHSQNLTTSLSTPVTENNPDRITVRSYHLKDNDDFPPLGV